MDWLATLVNGANGVFALGFALIVIIVIVYLIKKGILSFEGKGFQVGKVAGTERQIMRMQMQYVNTRLDATIKDVPPHLREGLHYYRTKYIISKVKDLFEETIIYNHISDDEEYILLKQELAYNLVVKLTDDEYFMKPEFKDFMYDLVKEMVKRIVRIRKTYSEESR